MNWDRDLPAWPLSAHSRRIRCRPHEWHVQEMGTGPLLLLLHGAGASTHSWRDLIPGLAQTHRVVALDLPGHGFTRVGNRLRMGLERTAEDIAALCKAEDWQPVGLIGHSAGAAVAIELSRLLAPQPRVVALNAALDRFDGVAGWLFPIFAKMLALNPFTSLTFTIGGNSAKRARAIIDSTGSRLSEEGYRLYARLLASPIHVDGTLQMMARWSTDTLYDQLPSVACPTRLITGARDAAVPPRVSERAASRLQNAEHLNLPDLGHLAHEEAPDQIVKLIQDWC
ncbi:MAG: alpha/beta fold hydrolase BchO [Pseudomonadota bacterium]